MFWRCEANAIDGYSRGIIMSGIKKIARERTMTAREAAKKFGKSPRTIQRLVALDRDVYLDRAAERRQKAWDMRALGCSWNEIAEALETTYGGARSLYYQYLKHQKEEKEQKKDPVRDPNTLDMFE